MGDLSLLLKERKKMKKENPVENPVISSFYLSEAAHQLSSLTLIKTLLFFFFLYV